MADADHPTAQLEQRLAELRARRKQLDDEADAGAAERLMLEQIEVEERAIRDREALAKAEADHGPVGKKIAVVQTAVGDVIVKRSNPLHFRRFQDAGKTTSDELERLVRPCVVYPDIPTFERWLEEQPAALLRCANAICELAGIRTKEVEGKS
jgi:hypothetical protein